MPQNCPICGRPEADVQRTQPGYKVTCEVCSGPGYFIVGTTLMHSFQTKDDRSDKLRPYLSAYIRQHRGTVPVLLTCENWTAWAEGIQAIPVATKIEKLLRLVSDRSSFPGHFIEIDGRLDYPLTDAANSSEFQFMLEHLQDTGLIRFWTQQAAPGPAVHAKILAKGWERLQASGNKGIPGRCFVAMSFDPTLNDAYNLAIEPAVIACGLNPRRVDKILDNRNIDEKIIAELRDAELVVADFTLQRNGVYFETGFARGLGREVFWCCRKDDLKNLHFDTRQFNFLVWSTLDELKEGLTNKIKAMGLARN